MLYTNPLTAIDCYKATHKSQYPLGTSEIYSNLTARNAKLVHEAWDDYDDKVVFFGLQYFLKSYLVDAWSAEFFAKPKHEVLEYYKSRMDVIFGSDFVDISHIAELHDLGYLPLRIKALPEGMRVPIGVPLLTVVNTHPRFFWLTNYIETALSNCLWKPMTSASTAFEYRKLTARYSIKTGSSKELARSQVYDFSFRGASGIQDAALSSAGHLTSFLGTSTIPALGLLEDYYESQGVVSIHSLPSTEHSVMGIGTQEGELETFKRLLTEVYPKGAISIVSDTWNLWKVLTEYLPILKQDILNRDGKFIIRPDSGNPVKIVNGDPEAHVGTAEYKGVIECLWEVFGGTKNSAGYKVLDQHIGIIYGDAIIPAIARAILQGLEDKGFASVNICFGVGSQTYQSVTRDYFGFAMKATSGVVNGVRRDIFKCPKTDSGVKKSARGLLRVVQEGSQMILHEQQSEQQESEGLLDIVFLDGKIIKSVSFTQIRERVDAALEECLHE